MFDTYKESMAGAYIPSTHQLIDLHLSEGAFSCLEPDVRLACEDHNGCEIILLADFVQDYQSAGSLWKMIAETKRLFSVKYCYVIPPNCNEFDFKQMDENQKIASALLCVRIILDSKDQDSVRMQFMEGAPVFEIPYIDIMKHYVIAPERYQKNQFRPVTEQFAEKVSDHVCIIDEEEPNPLMIQIQNDDFYSFNQRPIGKSNHISKKALLIQSGWFPEFFTFQLQQYYNEIIYGTIPGVAGEISRLERVLSLRIPLNEPLRQIRMLEDGICFSQPMSFLPVVGPLFTAVLLTKIAQKQHIQIVSDTDISSVIQDKREIKENDVKTRLAFEKKIISFLRLQHPVYTDIEQLVKMLNAPEIWENKLMNFYLGLKNDLEIIHTADFFAKDLSEGKDEDYTDRFNNLRIVARRSSSAGEKILNVIFKYITNQIVTITQHRIDEEHKRAEEERIRADERKAILYEMSHHIKNLIISVVDPLKRLSEKEQNSDMFVLKSALSGAEMIKQIVWCINNSYRTTPAEFQKDLHNPENTSLTLGGVLKNALRCSVNNMFDGEQHSNYMKAFFPTKEQYHIALKAWEESQQSISAMLSFINRYMMKCTIDMENSIRNLLIGNRYGSSTKLLIVFNELFMNALKALASTKIQERYLRICFCGTENSISFSVTNSYRYSGISTGSGHGRVIVQNFVKGFGGIMSTEDKDNHFQVTIIIPGEEQ